MQETRTTYQYKRGSTLPQDSYVVNIDSLEPGVDDLTVHLVAPDFLEAERLARRSWARLNDDAGFSLACIRRVERVYVSGQWTPGVTVRVVMNDGHYNLR